MASSTKCMADSRLSSHLYSRPMHRHQMPTGTGKTITLLSLITSYQLAHPEVGKLIYCTRTVPEMEKVLAELKELVAYRQQHLSSDTVPILALGLSSRKNLCIHPRIADEGSRESVDSKCRQLTASWVRERAGPSREDGPELCDFFEGHEKAGADALLPAGVYTLADLRSYGKMKTWCPYFLARHMIGIANVVVYNYQYMIDPKVSQMVSRELEKECIVVFDEAHNIDNVCIESLSVSIRQQTLVGADRNLTKLRNSIARMKETDSERLKEEYKRLVDGLVTQGALRGRLNGGEEALANPALPEDIIRETVPGNIRRAEHFVAFMNRFVAFLKEKLKVDEVVSLTPAAFVSDLSSGVQIDAKTLRFCYDRLSSLMKTLEVSDMDEYGPLHSVADFCTLIGTYAKGFAIIVEPFDMRTPNIRDPVIQLSCLDASLAMKPIFSKFQSVVITSGTLSPIDLYPKILNFHPVSIRSFAMTLTRDCMCPVVVTKGLDEVPLTTAFEQRNDPQVREIKQVLRTA
jgi:DNA excision repair protein ERCC-2